MNVHRSRLFSGGSFMMNLMRLSERGPPTRMHRDVARRAWVLSALTALTQEGKVGVTACEQNSIFKHTLTKGAKAHFIPQTHHFVQFHVVMS